MKFAMSMILLAGMSVSHAGAAEPETKIVGGAIVKLKIVSSGAYERCGSPPFAGVPFSGERRQSIGKVPEVFTAPRFGAIPFAGREVAFVHEEPEGRTPRTIIDVNENGDFTDDPAVTWIGKEYTIPGTAQSAASYEGAGQLNLGTKERPMMVAMRYMRFDPRDTSRAELKDALLIAPDYCYEGRASIGGKSYNVILADRAARGDFAFKPDEAAKPSLAGPMLRIDTDNDGKYEDRESDAACWKTFTLNGMSYAVADMARDGSSFRVGRPGAPGTEKQPVADAPRDPNAMVFSGTDTAGKRLNFPDDFKGKIVLVDFWATWCGPCMSEMPNVVKAYKEHKAEGFEVVGISLDNAESRKSMSSVMKANQMTWRQIADGKGWKAELAVKFGIKSIPATFLVDGTTGRVIEKNLRGAALDRAIEKALAEKAKDRK